MSPQQQATPFVPPATPLPTRDTAAENLDQDARLKQRQGMEANQLSAGGGLQQTAQAQKAGMSATKKLLGQAV